MILFGYEITIKKHRPSVGRGKHLLNRETIYRTELKHRSIKNYQTTLDNIRQYKAEHNSSYGIFITGRARKEIGYSDTTASVDIFRSITKFYEKHLQNSSTE